MIAGGLMTFIVNADYEAKSVIRESIGLLEGRLAVIQKEASTARILGFWSLGLIFAVLWHLK
ncbi:hypothetical protein CDA09_09365 [Azoarcus sp. DN11]|nr:hypothetical protein CDA09_09365 [Azoarcus sp. DN11]